MQAVAIGELRRVEGGEGLIGRVVRPGSMTLTWNIDGKVSQDTYSFTTHTWTHS